MSQKSIPFHPENIILGISQTSMQKSALIVSPWISLRPSSGST